MRHWKTIALIAVVALGSFLAGNYYGHDAGGQEMRAFMAERETALKAVNIQGAFNTLLMVRDDPSLLVEIQESNILLWLREINLDSVDPKSFLVPVLREDANRFLEYRSRYPDTKLDPAKNAKLQKLLTFAGPSGLPNLMTTPVKK